jgi:hypothetical protein
MVQQNPIERFMNLQKVVSPDEWLAKNLPGYTALDSFEKLESDLDLSGGLAICLPATKWSFYDVYDEVGNWSFLDGREWYIYPIMDDEIRVLEVKPDDGEKKDK